ncbi:hypothetical protein BXZ70DRAFT_1068239 [Cristinia sonorae]|uniref:RNA polymerase II-associated protein 1 C-terminal domain-containing protein n=1 Tax=Cristinia sonorae TaxID=1940300 RepID=A0A8K0XKI2_9AGAR|nr:hypothetical protein BXZ70DRAFT_1068239 [Cristinia sonorae]
MSNSALIGSVIERKAGPSVPPKPNQTGATGFPSARHRSQSAFSKARGEAKKSNRAQQVPVVESLPPPPKGLPNLEDADDWRRQAEEENQRRVACMSHEEREQEKREILERFGPNIADVLRKAREAREAKTKETVPSLDGLSIDTTLKSPTADKRVIKSAMASRPSSPPPESATSTRPSSRADRRLRFAELTPQDVHVYESAPPSPRKKALALPPPTPDDGPTTSLGTYGVSGFLASTPANGEVPNASENGEHLEEGTPEYIRRHFFPSASANDPALAWINTGKSDANEGSSNSTLRFDLSGAPIPPEVSSTLPTHLGLHHHAEGSHAGYTLDDLFLLSRSTVPGQRASMLDVLGRIARRIGKSSRDVIEQLKGQETILRKRILAAGVEAMGERGTLGIRAVEVMWVCIVAWDDNLAGVEGAELKDFSEDGALASIPLDFVLPQISNAFAVEALPQESLIQLLAIIHRLALESNEVAETIVGTKNLISNLLHAFILTPYPPEADSPLPKPFAIQVLTTLANASRSNASSLRGSADALLRFILTLPPLSPYPLPLATSLLASTFQFYTALASYGLYAQTAGTAHEPFHRIRQYVLSDQCQSVQLKDAWLGLLESWMVCARDPHMTTPDHDILWSQVVAWGWAEDILALRQRLTSEHTNVWTSQWRSLAAWLEGASVNSVKGGESEKNTIISAVRDGFANGVEHTVIEECMRAIGRVLPTRSTQVDMKALATHAKALSAAIRLWLSCLPSSSQQGLNAPPFSLPFPQITALCGRLASHPIWGSAYSQAEPSTVHVHLRALSCLLAAYLDMSRVLPGTTDDLWIAQALSILPHLLPGDEESAIKTICSLVGLVNPSFMASRSWLVPPAIWDKNALEAVAPFLTYSLQKSDTRIGATWMTPQSIKTSTTQRLPPLSACQPNTRNGLPLPMGRDWLFSPLDYLLRSGETDIFKSLPSSWDASEVDLVRATFLLARVARQVLTMHGLGAMVMTREETVFGCMKVFMLEHGQQQESETSAEEVFRDAIVGDFMKDLLAPFTIGSSSTNPESTESTVLLDVVATRFLGPSTPFYQYYTDFVGLYDSISFSHPLFARLLLPPISMRYPSDFRKYLWVDYAHVIRTIKTPVEDVVAGSIAEYLWPVETNAEIITGYLRATTKGHADGFLRLVAVHHIACNIWPDLRSADEREDVAEERAVKLLQAVDNQGQLEGVREIVTYRQTRDKTLMPPACFEQKGDWIDGRKALAVRCGHGVMNRLEKLFSHV